MLAVPPGKNTGIVTILFTDIEGSTLLWEQDSERMRLALARHDAVLRSAVESHRGIVVKMMGDGMHAAFDDPLDAVSAALQLQQTLADESRGVALRVRCGLHLGVVERRDSDLFGSVVNRTSRIMSMAHGGQVLLSQAVAGLVHDRLPPSASLRDLGKVRLRDFAIPEQVYQLVHPSLRREFPALRALEETPNNLPRQATSFVGREDEQAEVLRLLANHRLVTLIGPGGVGKTRLSLQVGFECLSAYPDGIWFVDLAPLSEAQLVAEAAAGVLGLPLGAARSPVSALVTFLKDKKTLVMLDNCEHLIAACAQLADAIIRGCPGVVLMASSREALVVPGEHVYHVGSLATPDRAEQFTAEVASRHAAVRLFVDRASATNASFALTDGNASTVVEICRRLDGIPLAIELAAPRVKMLSPEQILNRLNDRFRILTEGARTALPRQQTLRATIDWSYDLLSVGEKTLLARLAVFAGAFRLDAAEAVCIGEGIAAGRVLDLLGSLVSKSLVTTVADEAETRYRLLETVRMYASDKLSAAGEAARVRSQHRDWYLRWLEAMTLEELSFSSASLKAVNTEIDNLRVAAEWSVGEDRPDLLARLVIRLYGFWFEGNPNQEGRRWLEHAVREDERLSAEERVACYAVLSAIATLNYESDLAVRHATRAIDAASGRPSPFLATALGVRAFGTSVQAAWHPEDAARLSADMRHDAQAAMDMAQISLPGPWRASAELWAAGAEANVGNLRVAAQRYCACTESSIAIGKPYSLWFALAELAGAQHLLDETEAALASALRFLTLLESVTGPSDWQRYCAVGLMPALYTGGQCERATQILRDMAPAVRRNGMRLAVNHLLTFAAVVEYLDGHPERAGRLLGAARHLGGAQKLAISFGSPISMAMYVRYLPLVRSALGSEEAHLARERGFGMTLDDALTYAMEGRGRAGA